MRQPCSESTPGVENRIAGAARNLGTLACLILAVCCFQPRLAALLPSPPTGLSTSENLQSASAHPIASTTPARRSKWITRPIEQLRCGDRIPAELPASEVSPPTLQPDPDAWRLIKLELIKENGQAVEVTLLRPLQWLRRAGAVTNGSFPVQLEELGIRGQAAVLDIGPCPHIQSGPGRLVTGTFRHVCADLVRLRVAGSNEPITCTTGHPIWSEDRDEFVAAASLSVGEQLRLLGGRKTSVVGIEQLPRQPTRVCNLEVAGTHTYHVGTGLLVHNAVAKCGAEGGTQADGSIRFKRWKRGDSIDKPLPDGAAPDWGTVQSRYWKNRYEASRNTGEFSPTQLAEMRKGNAPYDFNPRTGRWERRELHHVNARRHLTDNSPLNLRELTRDWHAEVDPFRRVPGIMPNRGIR
ncbi:polymorphic toxin-type HINT domain-containing protein [Roseiconus nitratireducens]|nr:polymorphic toxin-type HINT domain-containing protein [Roseiconus nitratireducens]